jgi:ketosteroid isomerase-like protein
MMTLRAFLTVTLFAAFISGCSDASIDQDAEAEALMALSREWSAHVGAGDFETALEFWAKDAIMLPSEMPALNGRQAIQAYIEGASKIPGFKISWEPLQAHVSQSGDMAYLIEKNITEFLGPDGEPVVVHGKVVTVWRKDEEGNWKNVVDMWNGAPAPSD